MVLIDGIEKENMLIGQGLAYGYGVFETIKIVDRKPVFLDKHIQRMTNSMDVLGIGNLDKNRLVDNINKAIDTYNPMALKINIIKGDGNRYHEIITDRKYAYHDEQYKHGFKLCFAKGIRNEHSRLVFHKTNNYLDNILELRDCKKHGFDECIFLNTDGLLCEGSISNAFLIKNKTLYTPSIECGILNGIIRSKVIEIAKDNGIEVIEKKLIESDIYEADSMFVTNSLMDVMPVKSIENHSFKKVHNRITLFLIDEIKGKEG